VASGRGELFPGQLLLMDPKGLLVDLPGTHTTEPAFGLPATWVDQSLREEASFRGYTVVDPGTVMTTHLTEVLKSHMAELLSYAETKKLLDDLPAEQKKLVEELIPAQISITGVQRVLQALLTERVSIRDLPAILEGIAEALGHTKNVVLIGEHVRARLSRQLCHQHLSAQGFLPIIALSPAWEQAFAEALTGQGDDRQGRDVAERDPYLRPPAHHGTNLRRAVP
jgi:flagellar biosynthesis protein FlhA